MRILNRLVHIELGRDLARDLDASVYFALAPRASERSDASRKAAFQVEVSWNWLPNIHRRPVEQLAYGYTASCLWTGRWSTIDRIEWPFSIWFKGNTLNDQ